MRAFDASDVLYDSRVIPFIKSAFSDAGIGGQTIATSQFLNEISWVSPAYVASRLDQQLSTDAGDDGDGGERDPPSRPARACTAPASTPPPTAASRCSRASRTA